MVTPAPEAAEAPERRQLTVMFTDLVGSTDLASALDPEEWHDVLNAYQHRVAAIVSAHSGVIAQFQGDGAVAYFGYPEAQESASRDALMAGMQIVEDMGRLGAEFPAVLGVSELQARAGLHTGEVLVAPVTAGGGERLPDVWGQVPNMAARLQAVGAPGHVVISGETAALVSGFFDLESLGTLTLKGIGHPVPAFRVLGRSGARNRLEARPLTDFIPRASAADWLGEQWSQVSERSGRLVIVSGEPGIGKSRLLLEFSQDLAAQEHVVVTLACSRRGSLSPLHPFGDVMTRVPATPQEAARWVQARAVGAPLLLVVEDAHWADPSTLEAVELIARAPAPVLVVMSARPEIADNPQAEPDAELLLGRLSDDEARAMLEQLAGAAQLDEESRAALVRRADGVPLFLEELARGVEEGSAVPALTMPTTLSEVITARLDRVGQAKRVAQAASVIGRTFDRLLLEAATELRGPDLDAALLTLQEHALIEPAPKAEELQFRHALIHEASYRSVLRVDRVRIHGAVGVRLVELGRAQAQPEVAAFHFGAAGDASQAVPLWKAASHRARQNARFREAAGHERETLALVGQLPDSERDETELKSRSRLVLCLTAVDQSAPDALIESRRVEELARRLGNRPILLRNYLVLIPWWQASADYAEINRILHEARTEAETLGDGWTLGLIDTYEGTTRVWQGMLTDGLAQLRGSYASSGFPLEASLCDLPPMPSVELMALAAPRVATALACWLTGKTTEAWRIAHDVLRCTTERDVPQARAVAAVTAAIMAQLDGDRGTVNELAGNAVRAADEVTTRQWQQWARSLQWWAGEGPHEPELPGPLLRPYFEMLLADDVLASAERARALLNDALRTARTTGEQFCESEILRVRAGVMRRDRQVELAGRDYEEAVTVARHQGARMLELRALTDWWRLPGAPNHVHADLEVCVAATAEGGPSRSLDEARRAMEEA
jgi:class 3 adenylate cyclase